MKCTHSAVVASLAALLAASVPARAQTPSAQAPIVQPPVVQAPATQPPVAHAPTTAKPAPSTSGTPADALIAPAARPQPPLVLLLDGLGVYVETPYIGVSLLAGPLQKQGFRTRTDSHLMTKTQGVVPDVIIGHSMGGETALRYARQIAQAGRPAPLVITIDAAPVPPACAVPRCVNIAGPGFQRVRGAVNVSAWDSGARFIAHAQLPTHPAVQRLILNETGAWMTARRASARVAASKPAASSTSSAPASTAGAAPTPPPRVAAPQVWTIPGWTLPASP